MQRNTASFKVFNSVFQICKYLFLYLLDLVVAVVIVAVVAFGSGFFLVLRPVAPLFVQKRLRT